MAAHSLTCIPDRRAASVMDKLAFLRASWIPKPNMRPQTARQRWNGANSVDPANASKTPANRGLAEDQNRFNQFGGSAGGPVLWTYQYPFA